MYAPARHDEITGLTAYVDQQLTAIRAAAIGLTDEQARATPCRSALSIGGLLKHATYVMEGALERLADPTGGDREVDEAGYAVYMGSFVLDDGETGASALAAFDGVRPRYLDAIRATDPSAAITEPPSPWYGIYDARPAHARFYLVHQVEELARHAGHADIIREQLDGVSIPTIVLSQEGMPANDFFQPYVPVAGTLGAPT